MKKLCLILVCISVLLPLACCANPSQESVPEQSTLAEGQQKRLDVLFDAAIEATDFQWDDTPKYIPNILSDNENFWIKVGLDSETKQKGLHFDLAPEKSSLPIGDYQFRPNFISVFYGTDSERLNYFRNTERFKKYERNGLEWFFSALYLEGTGLHVNLRYMIDENTICYVMVDLPNETELTDDLAYKMMNDFSCTTF